MAELYFIDLLKIPSIQNSFRKKMAEEPVKAILWCVVCVCVCVWPSYPI